MFGLGKLFGSIMGSAQAKAQKQAEADKAKSQSFYPSIYDISVTLSYEHGMMYGSTPGLNEQIQMMQNGILKAAEIATIYGTSTITIPEPPKEEYTESQKEIGKALKIKKYLPPKATIGIDWSQEFLTNQMREHINSYVEAQRSLYEQYYYTRFPSDSNKK